MKRILLPLLVIGVLPAASFAPSPLKSTVFYTARGFRLNEDPSPTPDARHVYFMHDSTAIYLLDRARASETRLLTVPARTVNVSAAGDRLAFDRRGEDGNGTYIWTLPLDRKTGLATGEPHRVSMTRGSDPFFAPDGNSIAFEAGTTGNHSIVIVPTNGGPERTIASGVGAYWPIHFTPDGKTVYYGLSFKTGPMSDKNGIYRVPADGGTSELVVRTADYGAYPGLSPDGKTLMYWEPSWDTVVVATADGKRISAYRPAEGEHTPDRWLTGNRLFGSLQRQPSSVSVMPMSGGAARLLTDTLGEYSEPRWSPDGRRVAIVHQHPSEFILMNADGSSRKVIHQKEAIAFANPFIWSPDSRSILYTRRGPGLSVIDISTGAEQSVTDSITCLWPQWRSDSRAVLYAVAARPRDADSTSVVSFHERTVSGGDRVLRSARIESEAKTCGEKLLGDSAAVTWGTHDGAYKVMNLFNQAEPRVIYDRPAQQSAQKQGFPSVSSDGRWFSVRREGTDGQMRVIELFKADGSARHAVTLPFATAPGMFNPRVMNDGTELIVASASGGNGRQYYHVDVASGKVTKLAMLDHPSDQHGTGVGSVSPDGKSIMYVTMEPELITFFDIDASAMLKGAPTKQK